MNRKFYVITTLAIALLIPSFIYWINVSDASIRIEENTKTSEANTILPHPALASTPDDVSIADIAESSVTSVVNIATKKLAKTPQFRSPFLKDPFFERFFGPQLRNQNPPERYENSLGSGVIVDENGTILTNNHVVENAKELKVTLHDNREFNAEIVGLDPRSDVAVIKITDKLENLKPLRIGNSDNLRLGDVVLAIGNPFGLGQTVTMGIISAKGRNEVGLTDYENFIQTDAAINPGNSGGALINMKGELVGINTAIASKTGGYQGIGFAIPTNMANNIMESILNNGKVVRGWLGIGIQELNPQIVEALDLEDTKGVLVSDIFKDGPADKGGLRSGDIIIKVDQEIITSMSKLRNVIAFKDKGTKVELGILRNGSEKTLQIELDEAPENPETLTGNSKGEFSIDGISVKSIDKIEKGIYNIPEQIESGVIVTEILPDQNTPLSILQPGDIIRKVNDKEIVSAESFIDEYKKSGSKMLLYVYREGRNFFIAINK